MTDTKSEMGLQLLRTMVDLGKAAVAGEAIAQPYLDAGAISVVDGEAQFHRDRFLAMLTEQMMRNDA